MEELIKDLQSSIERAEAYKVSDQSMGYSFQSAMELAYKYGVLKSAIGSAVIELNHLILVSKVKNQKA